MEQSDTEKFISWFIKTMASGIRSDTSNEVEYNNILHIMEDKSELQIPSQYEVYKFNKKIWRIKNDDDYIWLVKMVK